MTFILMTVGVGPHKKCAGWLIPGAAWLIVSLYVWIRFMPTVLYCLGRGLA